MPNYNTITSTEDMSESSRDSTTSGNARLVTNKSRSSFRLYLKQLSILLWKSFIVRRVHYIQTFVEFVGPILMVLALASINAKASKLMYPDSINTTLFGMPTGEEVTGAELIFNNPAYRIYLDERSSDMKYDIFYGPERCRELIQPLIDAGHKITSLSSEDQVRKAILMASENYVREGRKNKIVSPEDEIHNHLIGIYFDCDQVPEARLQYKIILPIGQNDKGVLNPFVFKYGAGPASLHYNPVTNINELASKVTSIINYGYIKNLNKNSAETKISSIRMMRMPYPAYKKSKFDQFSLYDFMGIYFLLVYISIFALIVRRITEEKSTKSKEMLRMIGMSDLVFWTSHLINHLIVLVWQFLVIIIILFYYPKYPVFFYTEPVIMFTVLIMFGVQMILFSMFISTIFNRPVLAVIVSVIIWISASALIFRQLLPVSNPDSRGNAAYTSRVVSSFFPFGSMIWFISIIGSFENLNVGMNIENLNSKTSDFGDFTLLHCMLAVLASYFIYFFLIWYLDNVWPWQHGVPKSPFFLFKKSYWFPDQKQERLQKPKLNEQVFEPDPVGLHPDIEIQNVTKIFKPNKIAVDHLWLNIYKNQLTVLLGHNGAGKSTLMNMITGLFKATKGQIFVNGYNVFINTNQARRNIGLCPQENILFNELTVFQHLKLYAILKNHSFSSVYQEVKRVLDLLKLSDKKDVLGINLSGGMKRKLQLGMALIGNTKILILDEPTSGLDPEARRVVWDLLISLRREKTILLTTHYMEEADVLGDRIAIMSEGKLCCSGSPFFLKNAFGTGYQLRVEKITRKFDAKEFLKVIQKYIPTAALKSEIETEVIYNFEEKSHGKTEMRKNLPLLIENIENNRKEYGINSFGLTYSTLEDVFIAVDSKMDKSTRDHDNHQDKNIRDIVPNLTKNSQLKTGPSLVFQRFFALLAKRFHYARRFWRMFIFQTIIPGIIIAFGLTINNKIVRLISNEVAPIELNPETLYGPNVEVYYRGSPTFYDSYKRIHSRYNAKVINVPKGENFAKFILKHNQDLNHYILKVLYGLEYNQSDSNPNIWYNQEQSYSIPLALLAFFQSLLELVSPQHLKNSVSIDVKLQPIFMKSDHASDEGLQILSTKIFGWFIVCLIFLPVAFPFLAASYIIFPINERVSKAKLIQFMSGVSPALFWFSHFVFDLICHLITITILYLILYVFDTERTIFDENSKSSAEVLLLLLCGFGVATIPLAYILSLFFNASAAGFTYTCIIFLVSGLMANLFFSIFDLMKNNFLLDIVDPGASSLPFLRIMPIFSMLFGYQKLFKANSFVQLCKKLEKNEKLMKMVCEGEVPESMMSAMSSMSSLMESCCPSCKRKNTCFDSGSFSFGKFGSGYEIVYLFISGLIFLSLVIFYEYFRQSLNDVLACFFKKTPAKIPKDPEDQDVINEKERVKSLIDSDRKFQQDQLLVYNLTKHFGNLTAVDHISFGVHHEECFGLLGINGAGKTTTFAMLTGDLFPSEGEAWMEGDISLRKNLREFRQNIGYCPQFDCLLDHLTGEEMLYLVASLRGIPRSNIPYDVAELVKMVGVQAHLKKTILTYSGGNKRKLSIALSLIGNPPLVFLDEPTSGVDPVARRKIWKTLELIKNNFNCAIILTSHSMEECEALCSRLAIMVNGRFRCLGSVQHLRQKYSQGFTVIVRFKRQYENDSDYNKNVQQRITESLPSASLTDSHQCLVNFHVADKNIAWSELFNKLADLSKELDFEDYIISDTTLESIFIMFARSQQKRQNSKKN